MKAPWEMHVMHHTGGFCSINFYWERHIPRCSRLPLPGARSQLRACKCRLHRRLGGEEAGLVSGHPAWTPLSKTLGLLLGILQLWGEMREPRGKLPAPR